MKYKSQDTQTHSQPILHSDHSSVLRLEGKKEKEKELTEMGRKSVFDGLNRVQNCRRASTCVLRSCDEMPTCSCTAEVTLHLSINDMRMLSTYGVLRKLSFPR